jgi:hypothetical protein
VITVDLVKVYVPTWVLLIKGDPETDLVIGGVMETSGVKEPSGVAELVFVARGDLVCVPETVEVFEAMELKVLFGLLDCDLVASGLNEEDIVIELIAD